MWTSNIKIWVKTGTQWKEAIVFVKNATEWRPVTGFIKTGAYEQVTVVPFPGLSLLPSVRGLNELSIQSLEPVRQISTSPLFRLTTIQTLNAVTPIVTSRLFQEVAIRLLPPTISISVNVKPW